MDKTIVIDGKEVKFRATARTPRLYRMLTSRDLIKDINELSKHYNDIKDTEETLEALSIEDLFIFENVAYVMARHANPEIESRSADEWLDTFEMFSIWEVLPQLLELWHLNNLQTSQPKKK